MLYQHKTIEFKDFSRFLSDFRVLCKPALMSKDFLRKPSNSSTFQACVNPEYLAEDNKISCSRIEHSVSGKSQTSDPSISRLSTPKVQIHKYLGIKLRLLTYQSKLLHIFSFPSVQLNL